MRTTTTLTLTALLLAGTATAGCSSQPTKEEIAEQCAAAIKARPEGDTAKPKACKGLSDHDYAAIVFSHVARKKGWIDKDGNPDMGKVLDDADKQQP